MGTGGGGVGGIAPGGASGAGFGGVGAATAAGGSSLGNGGEACGDGMCGDECVDVSTDVNHCGACGRECSTTGVASWWCEGGVCTSTCQSGYVNLNRPAAPGADDGCEVDLAASEEHCGAQGRACSSTNVATPNCEGGVCTSSCVDGYWNVNQPATGTDDGCEAECPPTTGGPALVRLVDGYCIDETEVTQGQYSAWLSGAPSGELAECEWNTDFSPTCGWDPVGKANYPVVCVDWCDAYAYCKGVGKRLCGKRAGGANGFFDFANPGESQWYNACVSGAAGNVYPYGNAYEADTCNGVDHNIGATLAVGTMPGCQSTAGGYEGVYDLSGNVWEWEDSCEDPTRESDCCRLRGDSNYDGVAHYLRCVYDGGGTRGVRSNDVGFRCCAP